LAISGIDACMVTRGGKSKQLKKKTEQEVEDDNSAQNAPEANPKTKRRKVETAAAAREGVEDAAGRAQDVGAQRKKRRNVVTSSDDKAATMDELKQTKEQTTAKSIDDGGRSGSSKQGKDKTRSSKDGAAAKKARHNVDSGKGERPPEDAVDREDRQRKKSGKGDGKGKKGGRGPKGEGKGGSGNWSDPKLRLFVHNLDRSCDEALLRRDFSECGELADVYVPTDKATGGGKGFAFITFRTSAGMEAALEYDGTDYGGKTIKVKRALEKGQKPESASALHRSEKPEGCVSIVCKRLAPEVTEADLKGFFSDCGAGPSKVGLLRDRATGRSRCTARVDFRSTEDVDEAMTKAAELRGHTFLMDYCKAK